MYKETVVKKRCKGELFENGMNPCSATPAGLAWNLSELVSNNPALGAVLSARLLHWCLLALRLSLLLFPFLCTHLTVLLRGGSLGSQGPRKPPRLGQGKVGWVVGTSPWRDPQPGPRSWSHCGSQSPPHPRAGTASVLQVEEKENSSLRFPVFFINKI